MLHQFTMRAAGMGLLAAFVGYVSSFAIVLSGLTAMGANEQQASTGLMFATLGIGVCGVWVAFTTRTPAAIAWSTPGAAFLASISALPGGFAEATGAFICCALMIVITGFIPSIARLVATIPKPVASALLAGVLLKLCFAPAFALGTTPLLILPILAAWLAGLTINKLLAMPLAVTALIGVLLFAADTPDITSAGLLPVIAMQTPTFSWQAFLSVSVPLYLVTMAGQNIPGFTLLELNQYPVQREKLLRTTGWFSTLIAPFGGIPVNMSAITAAMMCGEDAGSNPHSRYWAAMICGAIFILIAFFSSFVISVAAAAPAGLITAVAGLALIPALAASLTAAFSHSLQLEAPALTFLITASGMTLAGVSGAFWGVIAGVVVWHIKGSRLPTDQPTGQDT
jgi:benzoate membrane transport protein